MASIPTMNALVDFDMSGPACYTTTTETTLNISGYEIHYKEQPPPVVACLVCKRPIYLNAEAAADICSTYTSTTKRLLSESLVRLILPNATHVKQFSSTLLCMQCYSVLDRGDSLLQEVEEIRSDLKKKMADFIQTNTPIIEIIPPTINNNKIVKQENPAPEEMEEYEEEPEKISDLATIKTGKFKKYAHYEISIPSRTFLPTKESEKYTCLLCFRQFKHKTQLAEHFDIAHSDSAKVECLICQDYIRGGFKDFMCHLVQDHSLMDLKKGLGNLRLWDPTLMFCAKKQKHEYNDYIKLRKIFCVKCDVTLPEAGLPKHIVNKHPVRDIKVCEICHIKVAGKKLSTHKLEKHHVGNPIQCPHCPERFYARYRFNIHVRRLHEKEVVPDKKFQCHLCSKEVLSSYSLKLHHRLVHQNLRPHVCPVCNAAYKMKGTLNSHMLKHEGIRPYICEICSKSFNRVTECKKHLRKVHKIICNARFNDALNPGQLPIRVVRDNKNSHA